MATLNTRLLATPGPGGVTIYCEADPTSTHTVAQIYANGALLSTHVVGGSTVIDGTTYTTTPSATNLTYAPTVTTGGTEYAFTFDADTVPVSGTDLQDAVYTVSLLPADPVVNDTEVSGTVVRNDVMCKLAGMLEKAYCGQSSCPPEEVLEKSIKIYMLMQAAEINAANNDIAAAKCLYNIATNLADNGCGCGC